MLSDFLQDSPVYQEVFTKGRDEGFTEGKDEGFAEGVETGKMQALSQTRQTLGQGLLDLVSTRFPALEALARTCLDKINDTDALSHVIVEVGIAKTERDAKRVLESKLKA